MSAQYRAILWNRQKRIYNAVLGSAVISYLALFVGIGALVHPHATAETLLIRAFGTSAFVLLHVVLCIGPLCRLNTRFLPLLYNRRHMGVTTFLLAAVHGIFSLVQFHALGDVNPLVSLLTSNTRLASLPQFPFQQLGLIALVILFLMAATSHDFWLHTLAPAVWKRLHMLVYVAYVMLVGHVAFGFLQSERSPLYPMLLALGIAIVAGLHIAAAIREKQIDDEEKVQIDGFVDVCDVAGIPEKRARIVSVDGERVAVFRYDGRISALSNVCRHQNGPLGEGRIVDGCVTCPWHGYQYAPDTGAAPPPFDDRVATYRTRVLGGRVLLDPRPLPPGTRVEPACIARDKAVCRE